MPVKSVVEENAFERKAGDHMSTSFGAEASLMPLQQDPELLQALLSISELLVVALDTEGRIQLFNHACEELTDFRAEEIVGRKIWDTLIPGEELEDVRQVAMGLASGERTSEFTNHWLTRDGGKRLIHWRNTVLDGQGGHARYVVGTGIDITEREYAIRARQSYEHQFSRLVDTLPALVAHLDRDYRIRFANQGYQKWFGLDPQVQYGKHVREVIGKLAFSTLKPYFDQALSGSQCVYHGEVAYKRGGTRFIHGTYIPFHDDEGKVDGLYILAVDLTEENRLRWQLADQLRQAQTIVESAIDGIITIDRYGAIHSFNPAADKIFGHRSTEIIGHHISLLLPGFDPMQDSTPVGSQTVFIDPPSDEGEIKGVRKDGIAIDLQLSLTEFIQEEQLYIAFVRDISKRKRAEREARQHFAELAHVTRLDAMGEVTSGLAHEISQPLTAISAMSETCLMMLDNPDFDHQKLRETLVSISRQGNRAKDIVEQLRVFLRKDQPENLESCNPVNLVDDVLTLLRHEIEAVGVIVELDLEPVSKCCLVNRVQIEQVLFNLIKNAIDALREVEGDRRMMLVCRYLDNRNICEFRVVDTGPGIPEQYKDRLFHPFFTTKSEGLGQGLSICRSIIQRHGGSLEYQRLPEGESVFRFTLPAEHSRDG